MSKVMVFGQWLKQRRKALGLTQRDLAQQANCAEVTLRKIEAGDLRPSAQLVASLIKCLGVAGADLPDIQEFAQGIKDDHAPAARKGKLHRPNNLPAQLTPLLGREQDIAAVRSRLLDGARLITLVGPPGVGKTRLALAVAESVLEQFEHGVCFVRLGPLSDPGQVAPAIVHALGCQMNGPNPPAVQVRAYLEEKHQLLVLDNFEHVIEAAPLVDDLLRRCPWLHVLATSRQPLRVRGERQMPVLPLALPAQSPGAAPLTASDVLDYPAVALFLDRAQAVRPDFAITDANATVVAELCRRLDGLPLAIELVAARVKLLPPDELLAHLSGPWMLSIDGLRGVSARQKTLRGAIDWSYDLLTPAEQTLFKRLAVFVGGCTLEAAEAVCGEEQTSRLGTIPEGHVEWEQSLRTSSAVLERRTDHEGGKKTERTRGQGDSRNEGRSAAPFHVLDGIASLLDKSLLRHEIGLHGESRYVMLETIREYALERLAAGGEAEGAQNRHLALCLTVAASAVSEPFGILEQASWKQVDAEIHNLCAGLEWALQGNGAAALRLAQATSRTLANRGFVREALTWIDRTLTLPEAGEATIERAALLYCRGIAQFLADQTAVAELSMSGLLTLSRDLNLILGQAGAQYYLGRLASMSGNASRAEAYLEAAAAALLEAGDIVDWGHVVTILGQVVMFRGDLQRSRALHTQAMTRALPPEQRHHLFWSLGGLAELALLEQDYASAQRLAEECLALCRQRNNPGETAWPLTCLGEIATRRRDFAAAHATLDEALALGRKADSYWRVVIVRADLGDLAVAEGKPGEALRLYRETLPILLQRGIFAHPQGSLRLACLASAMGQHEVAATLLAACSKAVESGIEVLLPITQADFDGALGAAKAVLHVDVFEVAWAFGRSLSPQSAVTWGLQTIRVSEHPTPVKRVELPANHTIGETAM